MPEICRFDGIKIFMIYDDHNWPHVHVRFAGDKLSFDLRRMTITEGELPKAKENDFLEWAQVRERELLAAWSRAERHLPIGKIERLKR